MTFIGGALLLGLLAVAIEVIGAIGRRYIR